MNSQLTHMMAHRTSAERRHVSEQARLAREMRAGVKPPNPTLITSLRAKAGRISPRPVPALEVERQVGGTR
jgi:hypothetical protein